MWWVLAMGLAAAETPVGLEVGAGLALPHAGLGIAPGLRLLGEAEVTDDVWVGGEADARFPGTRKDELNSPDLATGIDYKTGQTALSLGARGSWTPGDPDGLRWRVGGSLGASRVTQRFETDAGVTREGASSPWIRPEGGMVLALGPGFLTAGLYWSISPARLEILGGGGSVFGLGVGWRHEL